LDLAGSELRESLGTPLESLSDEELRALCHPERRYLTVAYMQLQGLTQCADRLAPIEAKLMMDFFVEEACEAVRQTGCTIGETSRDAVLGIFGAPRYFADHPLRAILALAIKFRGHHSCGLAFTVRERSCRHALAEFGPVTRS
jgi:class 3 adenylate cyclase